MDNGNQILSIRENAKAELQQLKTIEDGMVHLSKLEGIEAWVKAQKLDAEIHALVLEQELRTKRIVGQLLKEGKENGTVRKPNQSFSSSTRPVDELPKTVTEMGLTHKQSTTFQKLASIPEEVFEEHIAEAKSEVETAVKKLTTTGAVKLAEQLLAKPEDPIAYQNKVAAKAAIDERISELLKEINAWPKLYRMKIQQGIKK